MDETCLEVMDISVRGWRLTEASVEEKSKELAEIVSSADQAKTTVVYQLYDDSSYMVKRSDGARGLPEKGPYGKYHVDGRLEVATREEAMQEDGQHLHPTAESRWAVQESHPQSIWKIQVLPLL